MESYVIGSHSIESTQELKDTDVPGFLLLVLTRQEWKDLPFVLGSRELDHDPLSEIRPPWEKSQVVTPGITFFPKLIHLGRDTHYFRFRDVDPKGKEQPIGFFTTPDRFVLFEWMGLTKDQINRWAKRGILKVPMDLANILALDLLNHYQKWLDIIESQMYETEKDILKGPRPKHQDEIIGYHQKIILVKKVINQFQLVFARMSDIDKEAETSFSLELKETTQQMIENVQSTLDSVASLRDAYQTSIQNRTNDLTKMLAIIATIFLPISLMTSFFGMNFQNMPLINKPQGLYVFYGISIAIIGGIIFYFWRTKWFMMWHKNKD